MRDQRYDQRCDQINSKTYKLLNRMVGKALHDYEMVSDGDRIAVCLSGGKDSWALLFMLLQFRKKAPIDFSIEAIHVDPGFRSEAAGIIEAYTRQLGVRIRIDHADFGPAAHSDENRENPCFLCAQERRRRLFALADELGCNKLAFGHNRDDLIGTLLLNLFYAGEMSTMLPCQPFFGGRLTVVRPLAYAGEKTIRAFAERMQWPVVVNPCPSAGRSKRAEINSLLDTLSQGNPKIRGNIFRAMRHVKSDYLPKP